MPTKRVRTARSETPPRFSILLPSRDRLDLLKKAVDSVLRQRETSFEIVISDNASSEDYGAYVDGLADPRVRLLRTDDPLSVTENWNRALEAARGDYIVMLGDDDALAPDYFARQSRLIADFDNPDVIYAMAYHYGYPDTVPSMPTGYLATVDNSPLFGGRDAPYALDPGLATLLGRRALRFRHHVSFNAQHFLYSRAFIASLKELGPFYQSPYPDYYACFVTFLLGPKLVVDPTPNILIGIAPKSFGFFLMNKREDEGEREFLHQAIREDEFAPNPAVAAALRYPGSEHTRSWLLAALIAQKNLATRVPSDVDFRRYSRIQTVDLAVATICEHRYSHTDYLTQMAGLEGRDRRFAQYVFRMLLSLSRSELISPEALGAVIREKLLVYSPVKVQIHDIGAHQSITDAVDWLEAQSHPPSYEQLTAKAEALRTELAGVRAAAEGERLERAVLETRFAEETRALNALLEDRERELADAKSVIAADQIDETTLRKERDAALGRVEELHLELGAAAARRDGDAAQWAEALALLRKELESVTRRADAHLGERQALDSERQTLVEQLKKASDETEILAAERETLRQALDQRAVENDALAALLAETRVTADQLTEQLAQARIELSEQIAKTQVETAALSRARQEAIEERDALVEARSNLEASLSWRGTAALRGILRIFERANPQRI